MALGLLVVSGGAVRLTGSGLGCPTWPHCTGDSVTAGHGFNHAVELGNRIVTILVFLGVAASTVLVFLRRPVRSDLRRLAIGLVVGYVGQAVLGGITVLTRLNPLAVGAHFLLSMALLWNGLVLYHRSQVELVDPVPVVGPEMRLLGRLVVSAAGLVLVVGTLVTGSGPHAGARVDNRLPFALRDIAEAHADLVLFLVGVTVATVLALRVTAAPRLVQRRSHWLLAVMLGQTAVGFTQYFLGLPAGLVEVHIAGATALWALAVQLTLDMYSRPALADRPPAAHAAGGDPATWSAAPATERTRAGA